MCPHPKAKPSTHPLIDESFFNSTHISCKIDITHDVLSTDKSYVICSKCYLPPIHNRVITTYTHAFQYGNVPIKNCSICSKTCCIKQQPLIECTKCLRAYCRLLREIYKDNNMHAYRQLVGLSINSITFKMEYGVTEGRNDPNNLDHIEERLIN